MGTLKQAAMNGLGLVGLPDYTVAKEVLNHRLVCVLPEWVAEDANISLVTPSRVRNNPAVQALITFLTKEFVSAVQN